MISMSWRAAWNTLTTFGIGHQLEERRKVDVLGHRIDDDGHVRSGHLDQAQLRPEGRFAEKFRVDRQVLPLRQRFAGGGKFGGCLNHQTSITVAEMRL